MTTNRMRFSLSYGLFACLLTIAACQPDTSPNTDNSSARTSTTPSDGCGAGSQPIKTVKNQAGVIYYNPGENQYTVIVTILNTIDSQDVGIVCNLPANLQVDGLEVTFDGEYKPYDRAPKAMTGGQSFYYLTINKLSSKKGTI